MVVLLAVAQMLLALGMMGLGARLDEIAKRCGYTDHGSGDGQ